MPEPEPEPEVEPAPEPEPVAQPEPSALTPPVEPEPEIDPDIALEEEKRKQELEEAERKAREEAERKEREEAERKAREEAERKEREAAERKAREEAERKEREEAERKAREEAERKAKEEEARKAAAAKKAAAEKAAAEKAAAEKKKRDALRAAMRSDVSGVAGIPGGTADRNQAGGGSDSGYGAQVRACIRPRVVYSVPMRQGNENPTVQYRVDLNPDGTPRNVRVVRSSGIPLFDEAVRKGIERCSPFPAPPGGKYPAFIDGNYRMYD